MSIIIKSTDGYDVTYSGQAHTYIEAWEAISANAAGQGILTIGQRKSSISWPFVISRSYLWFNTDSLPSDTVITSAKLYLYNRNSVPNYNNAFSIEIQRGIELDANNIPVVHHTPHTYGDYNKSLVAGHIFSATFEGTGLDDAVSGGTFTGINITNYKVEIDGVDPENNDTFKWSDNGGSTWNVTCVAITGAAQTLSNGVTITFGAIIGHTLTDYWTFSAYNNAGIIDASDIPEIEGYFPIDLNQVGIDWINKGAGAISKFCLRTDKDISGIEPVLDVNKHLSIRGALGIDESKYPYLEIITGIITGKSSITTSVDIILVKTPIINIKATKLAGSLTLYGEILESEIVKIVERGFEYKIQNNKPIEEDTGTEVKEEKESGFAIGEYHLSSWDTFNDLYCAEEDTIWWFRAYFKDDNDNKHIAKTWMKNVPTVTTDAISVTIYDLTGECNLTDLGANDVTKRGVRIVKNYIGNLWINDIRQYKLNGFNIYSMETRNVYAPNGVLIGFECVAILEKYIYTKNLYGYEIGEYETIIDALRLMSEDNYDIYAYAENNLGRGFGEKINVNTYQILVDDGGPISPYTKIETIRVMNIPEGYKVTRIGKRWGRTSSCNEGDIYEDGEWNNGDTITLFIVDLIPDTKYYFDIYYILARIEVGIQEVNGKADVDSYVSTFLSDGPLKNITGKANINSSMLIWWLRTDWSFDTPDDPDFPDLPDIETPSPDLVGIDYTTIVKEVKCDIMADQSIIDKYGRRRTLTIKNDLIQTKEFCKSIRDNYLNRFQELKLKIDIKYDIPLPFEREDTILLAYGQINYKTDDNGVIKAKTDGEGIINGKMSILTKIRKININARAEEAILTLELEV